MIEPQTTHRLSCRFTISSDTLTCSDIEADLPWQVTDSVERGTPTGQAGFPTHPYSIVTFDLGIPPADRADVLLERAGAALLSGREQLRARFHGRGLTLWIYYFYDADGAINFSPDAMRVFADLDVHCIFHLNPRPEAQNT